MANAPASESARHQLLPETAAAIRDGEVTPSGTDHVLHQEAGVAPHGGDDGGLPQLDMDQWAGQMIWLLAIFAVLLLLLSKVFLPRLRRVQDERAGVIASALEQARAVQAEADQQAEEARAEVIEARAEARASAAAAKARITEAANARRTEEEARVAARVAEAENRIRASRDQAMTSVAAIAADTTRAMVQHLTGAEVSEAEVLASVRSGGAA